MYERDCHSYHTVEVKYIFLLESLGNLQQFPHARTSRAIQLQINHPLLIHRTHAQKYGYLLKVLVCELTPVLRSKHRSEEHTSELQSRGHLVCRLLLEKKNKKSI